VQQGAAESGDGHHEDVMAAHMMRVVLLPLVPLLRWSALVATCMCPTSSIAAAGRGPTTTINIPYTTLPGGGKLPMLVMGDGVGWGRGT
jgi:hypothetical protein